MDHRPTLGLVGASRVMLLVASCGALASCAADEPSVSAGTQLVSGDSSAEGVVFRVGDSHLYVRSEPGRSGEILHALSDGTGVKISCQTEGEDVFGNSIWNFLPEYDG